MQKLVIQGGKRLRGELDLQGAKNSALPILSASLLCDGESIFHNCPCLSDIYSALRILNSLGFKCSFSENTATVKYTGICRSEIYGELMQEMRSSIIFLGAMLGRVKECTVSYPGGCELGSRPINMHLDGFRKMGVDIKEEYGKIICRVRDKIHGAKISLSFPSVGATENIMLCAVLADGETVINNSAREPEICDLAEYLRKCGAKIKGDGESRIVINGVKKLNGCEYSIMPDRIAGATYLSATASTGGEIILKNACINAMESFTSMLECAGCSISTSENTIYLRSGSGLKAIKNIKTMPYPGFPTDAQAVLMASLLKAKGTSVFEENIFDCRYRHTDALVKMGADIQVIGKTAIVHGVNRLYGATVEATDLRGGAGMAVAGLSAEGTTVITGLNHIDRGYENFEKSLSALGADIKRTE